MRACVYLSVNACVCVCVHLYAINLFSNTLTHLHIDFRELLTFYFSFISKYVIHFRSTLKFKTCQCFYFIRITEFYNNFYP